jgi:hypothetical protein
MSHINPRLQFGFSRPESDIETAIASKNVHRITESMHFLQQCLGVMISDMTMFLSESARHLIVAQW